MRIHVYHEHAGPQILEALAAREVEATLLASRDALRAALPEVEVLFCGFPPRGGWAPGTRLRLVQLMGAGADVLLPAEGLREEALVAGLRGVMAPEVSEHAIGLLLSLVRGLPVHAERQAERAWRPFASASLDGTTLLVVGLGAIGARVARLGDALGMHVIGVRRRARPCAHVAQVYEADALHEALAQAHHVIVTLPLTEQTRGLFDADALAACRPGAQLVHVGRGGVIDEAALLEALRAGQIGGAALDVFATEPLPEDSALWHAPNLLVTPHVAGLGLRYLERAVDVLLDNVARLERGEPLEGLVDRTLGY